VIPDDVWITELHRRYGSNQIILEHCRTVALVANILAAALATRGKKVDARAVNAGALLHDIGRNRTQTVRHGIEGAEIVEREGVDQKVVEIVRRHVGAGISPEEAKSLGLPDFDYIPRTVEERVVCLADKMVDSNKVRPFDVEVKRFERKGHDLGRLFALRKSLEDDLGEDPEKVIFDKIKESH
jgi:uncharacterized protein (TIGR00295 family)